MKINTKNLSKWARQFTPTEWELLCKSQDFLDIILDDNELAASVASDILKRKIEPNK